MPNENKPSRRQQILETLAQELENCPGERITTAALARAVGVSEAALYRHFPSKAKMYEALIEFIEESVFGLINRILQDHKATVSRTQQIVTLVLGFAARNPGISRLLTGDALTGETERLRIRINQFYERLETQLKQVLREGEMNNDIKLHCSVPVMANLLMSIAEGRMNQFVRSGFKRDPMEYWEEQWQEVQLLISQNNH